MQEIPTQSSQHFENFEAFTTRAAHFGHPNVFPLPRGPFAKNFGSKDARSRSGRAGRRQADSARDPAPRDYTKVLFCKGLIEDPTT
jgi:hypothetical protein